ncbi:MAG: ABC transporter permease [Proteobacteria bacterium]|nr:ABC transporter permease [Pseudomonadota bacterium]
MATAQFRAWRRFCRNRGALVGAFLVSMVLAMAVLAPLLSAHDPLSPDFDSGLTELGAPVEPNFEYPLGTDRLGRSVWSRLVHGAEVSLVVGFSAVLIAVTFGVLIGLVAGYAGGMVDTLLMRLVDMVLAFPFLLLAILLAALLRESAVGDGTAKVFITLGVVGWTTMARVVRGKVLTLREMDFIESARCVGASTARILFRHLLPNVLGPIAVLATLGMAQMILAESVLSYLSLGPPPPTPSWGRMLYEGQTYYRTAPWLIAAPGVAILITVIGFNLLGEGLRDVFDPKDHH